MIEDLSGIKQVLRRAVPPTGDERPRRDLWAALEHRMAAHQASRTVWLDWIVAAGTVAAAVALPNVVPTLLYLL